MHLPNYYNDEDWNDLTDDERQQSSQLYDRANIMPDDDINALIQSLYDEADEYETNVEGTSDIIQAQSLRDEAEQLINILRDRHDASS